VNNVQTGGDVAVLELPRHPAGQPDRLFVDGVSGHSDKDPSAVRARAAGIRLLSRSHPG
jgi:hypothetical protein